MICAGRTGGLKRACIFLIFFGAVVWNGVSAAEAPSKYRGAYDEFVRAIVADFTKAGFRLEKGETKVITEKRGQFEDTTFRTEISVVGNSSLLKMYLGDIIWHSFAINLTVSEKNPELSLEIKGKKEGQDWVTWESLDSITFLRGEAEQFTGRHPPYLENLEKAKNAITLFLFQLGCQEIGFDKQDEAGVRPVALVQFSPDSESFYALFLQELYLLKVRFTLTENPSEILIELISFPEELILVGFKPERGYILLKSVFLFQPKESVEVWATPRFKAKASFIGKVAFQEKRPPEAEARRLVRQALLSFYLNYDDCGI